MKNLEERMGRYKGIGSSSRRKYEKLRTKQGNHQRILNRYGTFVTDGIDVGSVCRET